MWLLDLLNGVYFIVVIYFPKTLFNTDQGLFIIVSADKGW